MCYLLLIPSKAAQKIADHLSDRLDPGPPFTQVGVDTFGPVPIVTRRTRGDQANKTRWGILFTCLTTCADSVSTSFLFLFACSCLNWPGKSSNIESCIFLPRRWRELVIYYRQQRRIGLTPRPLEKRQAFADIFWKRWSSEDLSKLQKEENGRHCKEKLK